MRCLTLANVLRLRGAHVRFISRHLPEYLHTMLVEQGHEVALIGARGANAKLDELAHASWLGVSQQQDAADSIQALTGASWDWVVVDHYALDFRWESGVRHISKNILAIDDIADRRHDCDILLDQNLYTNMDVRYSGKVPAHCRLLLGPRHALLREEFSRLHREMQPRAGAVRRIIVFFGGVDAENYTGRAIAALSELDLSVIQVDVVIGAQHPYRVHIETECAKWGYACYVQTPRMAELLAAADLAIGAGGTATWERCCLGVPSLLFCTANNQEQQLADAADAGLVYVPDLSGDLHQSIKNHVTALLENGHIRKLLSSNGMRMVNGRGAQEVAAAMGCASIELRAANIGDAEKLFAWRNHPSIRKMSRSDREIGWEEHRTWLTDVFGDPRKMLLIGEQSGSPIGVIRFDVCGEGEAEVSIYLTPEKQASGLGSSLLYEAEHWLDEHHPEITAVRAHVMGWNERSHRLFKAAGYQPQSTMYLKRLH